MNQATPVGPDQPAPDSGGTDRDSADAGPTPAARAADPVDRAPAGPPWLRWLDRSAARLPWASSLLVAVVQQVGSEAAGANQAHRVGLDALGRLLLLLGPLLLLLRHRHPRTAVWGVCAVALAYLTAGYPYGPIFLSVAVAGFNALTAGRRYAVGGAVLLLWGGHLLAGNLLYDVLPPEGDEPVGWGGVLMGTAWAVALVTAAELTRVLRVQRERERAEREAALRRRADEERLRIARELHDVLAHSISVINVQAGVGLTLLDSDPEQARTALSTIRDASREVLGEVRQVLEMLRAPGAAPRAPAPGLGRLPELVEQAAAAGLRVTVERVPGKRVGEGAALPPAADLAAFRIIQEALTNTIRHSGSRTARVRLEHRAGTLEVRVDDDGPATGTGPTGGGNGLVGMRERAGALGGSVVAEPRSDGGFRVTARLPLTEAAEAR